MLDEMYTGPKATLRPIHDKLMNAIEAFGAVRDRTEEGLRQPAPQETVRDDRPGHEYARRSRPEHEGRSRDGSGWRVPPGGMCQYKVKVTEASEVDAELIAWVRRAYDQAG